MSSILRKIILAVPSIFFVLNSGASNAGLRCPDMKGLYTESSNPIPTRYWVIPVKNNQEVDLYKTLRNLISSGYQRKNAPRMLCYDRASCKNGVNGENFQYRWRSKGITIPDKTGTLVDLEYYYYSNPSGFTIVSCRNKGIYSYSLTRLADKHSALPYLLFEMSFRPIQVEAVSTPSL